MRKIVVFIYAFLFALQSSLFSKENDVMSYLAEYDSLFQAVENDLRKNKNIQDASDLLEESLMFYDSISEIFDEKNQNLSIESISDNFYYKWARANFYMAKALIGKGEVLNASKHYFKALEIMNQYYKESEMDIDERMLLNNIYIGLGVMYRSQTHIRASIDFLQEALKQAEKIGNDSVLSVNLKMLGMSYMFIDMDSSLYYFDECVKACPSNYLNKIDIDKVVANFLYDKGETDSAYAIMRRNLKIIEHDEVRESYYCNYGDMLYNDQKYDSAIYYLEKSFESNNQFIKLYSSATLTSIYDSLGNEEKRNFYNSFVSKLAYDRVDTEIDRMELYYVYKSYSDKQKSIKKSKDKKIIKLIVLLVIVVVIAVVIITKHRFKRKNSEFHSILDDKEKEIRDAKFRYSIVEGKVKKQNTELQMQKDIIKEQEKEISEIKDKLKKGKVESYNLELFYKSEICTKILRNIYGNPLSQEDFMMLLKTANQYLDNVINEVSEKYPKLKNEDLCYLCLTILNLKDKQISSLFGVTYSTINARRKKICSVLDVANEELDKFILKKIL